MWKGRPGRRTPQLSRLLPVGLYEGTGIRKQTITARQAIKAAITPEQKPARFHKCSDNAVAHFQTVRLPMVLQRRGVHLEHLL